MNHFLEYRKRKISPLHHNDNAQLIMWVDGGGGRMDGWWWMGGEMDGGGEKDDECMVERLGGGWMVDVHIIIKIQ